VVGEIARLKKAVPLALDWLSDIAMKQEENLTDELNSYKIELPYWKGSIRNEYFAAIKKWRIYGPIWHTGQALKSLLLGSEIDFVEDKQKYLNAALESANFLLKNQIWDESDPNHGLLLAFEDVVGKITTSGIFEAIDSLFILSDLTKNNLYRERALGALDFCKERLYVKGKGYFIDTYDPAKNEPFNPYNYDKTTGVDGRPVIDDSVYFTAWKLTGNEEYATLFWEMIDRLILDEDPPGNWISYWPNNKKKGYFHPRHSFWWGRPFLVAYKEGKEQKYLNVVKRACDWYINAIRKDGGLFRNTYTDWGTESFGHATSGTACAVILWLEYKEATGTTDYNSVIRKCLNHCISMQFTNPQDKNLKGCILEKVLPPDGTDKSPYFIRDLGTIFFIQAAAKYLGAY